MRGSRPSAKILHDRQVGDQLEFLVDDSNSAPEAVERRGEPNPLAVKHNGAGVRLEAPRHDLDERRLARAVFAAQAMHLSRPEVEGHSTERRDAREMFLYVFDLQDRRNGRRHRSARIHQARVCRGGRVT